MSTSIYIVFIPSTEVVCLETLMDYIPESGGSSLRKEVVDGKINFQTLEHAWKYFLDHGILGENDSIHLWFILEEWCKDKGFIITRFSGSDGYKDDLIDIGHKLYRSKLLTALKKDLEKEDYGKWRS